MPPKLIINVQERIADIPLSEEEISIQPLVISTIPSSMQAIGLGIRLKRGESEVMTIKNIAIIVPTEIILRAESKTIEDKSPCCDFFSML